MTERVLDGTLYETPFPRVLFQMWKQEAGGRLVVRRSETERSIFFDKGLVIVEREGLSEPEFLDALVKKRILATEAARRCEREASGRGISRVRALTELGLLSPLPLWNLISSFYVRRLFRLFDAEEGRFVFEPGAVPDGGGLGEIQTLDLILQGIRQIRNPGYLERRVPDGEESIYLTAPFFLHRLSLEPHERYMLGLLTGLSRLGGLLERSELGETESRKVIFAFLCLDILRVRETKEDLQSAPGSSKADQGRVFASLNDKCAAVYKYVTKQIGPLTRTILGKSLEDIKPGLGPIFQKTRLLGDGRIEVDPALTSNAGHLDEDLFRQVVRGYDEILMAEVLAVKKALGPTHETALVRHLERTGWL